MPRRKPGAGIQVFSHTSRAHRAVFALLALLFIYLPSHAAEPPDLEEQTRALAAELRCVVCQNLSVADSPSEMAQQMRAIVRERLEAGETPEQVREYFVSKYGEWVLLKPKTSGVSLLLWVLPYAGFAAALLTAVWLMRRWVRKSAPASADPPPLQGQPIDFLRQQLETPDAEDSSARAELLRERERLAIELSDLAFDYQAGKHSESDYNALRAEVEAKAVAVMEQLSRLPAAPAAKARSKDDVPPARAATRQPGRSGFRRWQLAAGGAFLLLFGLALGVLLTQSLRPRASEGDTITGDFMTGTGNSATERLLNDGKQAFARHDFPQAIESFKQVLAQEPNQPEAHAYMGFILLQAGHGDGALMAFDKALSVAPDFPMALWGKGMTLYQDKKDYDGAKAILSKLARMMPEGAERNEVTKVLAEISGEASNSARTTRDTSGAPVISGKITLHDDVKAKLNPNAALFIIARRAGGAAGPPLAVKKIDKPRFPLAYSLGQENVMIQGTPLTGKISLSARLDKDGNAMTREPGDITGEYRKNPVDAGSKSVDIVLDQIAQ